MLTYLYLKRDKVEYEPIFAVFDVKTIFYLYIKKQHTKPLLESGIFVKGFLTQNPIITAFIYSLTCVSQSL